MFPASYCSIPLSYQTSPQHHPVRDSHERRANQQVSSAVMPLIYTQERGHIPNSAPKLAIHDFLQPFQENIAILPQMKPRPLPSTSFPIHYSLITAPFEALRPETSSLKKMKEPQSIRKQRKVCYFHLPFPSLDSSVSIVTTLRGATGPRLRRSQVPRRRDTDH
jgi:hypothetical protein